jgi:hypothetical protein
MISNQADYGGAFYLQGGTVLSVNNSIMSNNYAFYRGSLFFASQADSPVLDNTTIAYTEFGIPDYLYATGEVHIFSVLTILQRLSPLSLVPYLAKHCVMDIQITLKLR